MELPLEPLVHAQVVDIPRMIQQRHGGPARGERATGIKAQCRARLPSVGFAFPEVLELGTAAIASARPRQDYCRARRAPVAHDRVALFANVQIGPGGVAALGTGNLQRLATLVADRPPRREGGEAVWADRLQRMGSGTERTESRVLVDQIPAEAAGPLVPWHLGPMVVEVFGLPEEARMQRFVRPPPGDAPSSNDRRNPSGRLAFRQGECLTLANPAAGGRVSTAACGKGSATTLGTRDTSGNLCQPAPGPLSPSSSQSLSESLSRPCGRWAF